MTNSNPKNKRFLFVALSGIGNLLMQLPTIRLVKKTYPNSHITLWVAPRGTKALAENESTIDEVVEASIKTTVRGHIQNLKRFRALGVNTGIVLSPGQQIKSAAYLWLSGIPQRIGHQYPLNNSTNSGFLLTHSIPENPSLHDIEQNLTLARLAGITLPSEQQEYSIAIPPHAKQEADTIFRSLTIAPSTKVIGFHAGSAPDFLWKRWPLENFAQLGKQLISKQGAHVLLFGGKDETGQNEIIKKMIGSNKVTIIQDDLITVAAAIQHCSQFVSNDSGLMHLAAASGVETFGLFGPTDEKKTGPRGIKTHVIRAAGTKPVYDTEKNYNLGKSPHETIIAITPAMVLEKISK